MSDYNAVAPTNTDNASKFDESSQSAAFSHYSNLSAQLPINPVTGKLVEGGIKEHTKQALTNIKAVIESVDHVMEDMDKVNIYVKDLADMDAVKKVYTEYIAEGTPPETK